MLTTLNLIVTLLLIVGGASLLIGWAACAAGKWADERAERLREDAKLQRYREDHARLEAERRKAQGLTTTVVTFDYANGRRDSYAIPADQKAQGLASYARRDDPENAA